MVFVGAMSLFLGFALGNLGGFLATLLPVSALLILYIVERRVSIDCGELPKTFLCTFGFKSPALERLEMLENEMGLEYKVIPEKRVYVKRKK